MRGETAISGSMAGKILKEFARLAEIEAGSIAGQLTPREKEVLQRISEGLSNKEIGLSLCISENTVKAHVTNILKVTSPDPLSGRQRPTLDDWGYIRGTKFVQKYTKY